MWWMWWWLWWPQYLHRFAQSVSWPFLFDVVECVTSVRVREDGTMERWHICIDTNSTKHVAFTLRNTQTICACVDRVMMTKNAIFFTLHFFISLPLTPSSRLSIVKMIWSIVAMATRCFLCVIGLYWISQIDFEQQKNASAPHWCGCVCVTFVGDDDDGDIIDADDIDTILDVHTIFPVILVRRRRSILFHFLCSFFHSFRMWANVNTEHVITNIWPTPRLISHRCWNSGFTASDDVWHSSIGFELRFKPNLRKNQKTRDGDVWLRRYGIARIYRIFVLHVRMVECSIT